MVATSNFRIEDFTQSGVDAQALLSRCRLLHLFAPIAETLEEEREFQRLGKPYVPKPRSKILPEALLGLYICYIEESEYDVKESDSRLEIQTLPNDWQSKYPLRPK